MTRSERILTILMATALLACLLVSQARASDLPCDGGSAKHVIKCLNGMRGLHSGSNSRVLAIADCEGAVRPSFTNPEPKERIAPNLYQGAIVEAYIGPWSLLPSEFHAFIHQGPKWVDDLRRENDWNGHDLYSSTVAVLAHGHRFGWGWSSCA